MRESCPAKSLTVEMTYANVLRPTVMLRQKEITSVEVMGSKSCSLGESEGRRAQAGDREEALVRRSRVLPNWTLEMRRGRR